MPRRIASTALNPQPDSYMTVRLPAAVAENLAVVAQRRGLTRAALTRILLIRGVGAAIRAEALAADSRSQGEPA